MAAGRPRAQGDQVLCALPRARRPARPLSQVPVRNLAADAAPIGHKGADVDETQHNKRDFDALALGPP